MSAQIVDPKLRFLVFSLLIFFSVPKYTNFLILFRFGLCNIISKIIKTIKIRWAFLKNDNFRGYFIVSGKC